MKIFVAGTRGVPNIPGGVETHCSYLYPLIVDKGYTVRVCRRRSYVNDDLSEWKGVSLKDVFSPRNKRLEAIVHTFLAVLEAKKWNADILHIHAVGPALMIPLARLLGLSVVFTNHGPDYDRKKWGFFAKFTLRLGEKLGGIYANEVIVISGVIRDIILSRCHRPSHLIYNGVESHALSKETGYLNSLGVNPSKYILSVARFVPEKGLLDLISAYSGLDLEYKLVIVGDADHEGEYSLHLKEMAKRNPNIILTGYITGKPLNEVYSHAALFVLPSYHEGLPIALLEALSYGVPALVSDIPANIEVGLAEEYYFRCKDVVNLREQLVTLCSRTFSDADKQQFIKFATTKYDWNKIAEQTISVYKNAYSKQ